MKRSSFISRGVFRGAFLGGLLGFALVAACSGKSKPAGEPIGSAAAVGDGTTPINGGDATPAGSGHDGHAMGSGAHDGHAMGSGGHDGHATGGQGSAVTPDPAKARAELRAQLLAAETAAFDKAKPVFDKWCAKCHATGNKLATKKKLDHFDMTTYPFAGHHAMEISGSIRKSLAIGGGKPTMPFDKKGAVKGEELALITAWADAFDASHKGGAHESAPGHGGHGHKH